MGPQVGLGREPGGSVGIAGHGEVVQNELINITESLVSRGVQKELWVLGKRRVGLDQKRSIKSFLRIGCSERFPLIEIAS